MRLPAFESLSDQDAAKENIDTPDELEYGEAKRLEREGNYRSLDIACNMEPDNCALAIVNDDAVVKVAPRRGAKSKFSLAVELRRLLARRCHKRLTSPFFIYGKIGSTLDVLDENDLKETSELARDSESLITDVRNPAFAIWQFRFRVRGSPWVPTHTKYGGSTIPCKIYGC